MGASGSRCEVHGGSLFTQEGKERAMTYSGSCFCGAVEFTVSGEPVAVGYCHCGSCRRWSASPVNAFSLWQPEALQITRGADRIGVYNKSELSYRKYCSKCG